jgi:hypothetical protein
MIFLTGCSVARKSDTSLLVKNKLATDDLFRTTSAGNISNTGFFIEKAEVKLTDKEGSKRLLASVKFMEPQQYLISLRGSGGIEAARIFVSKDSVMINDRMNRITYFGSLISVERKFGFNPEFIPLLLGDFIVSDKIMKTKPECPGGMINVTDNLKGIKVDYLIDCKKGKSVMTKLKKSSGDMGWELEFEDFSRQGERMIPGKITSLDNTTGYVTEVRILKISVPWEGEIKFIPGNRYEKILMK